MILNAYAVLGAAMALLRLSVGLLVIALATAALRRYRMGIRPESRTALEDRHYLLTLLALLLLGLNVAAWPLLYLLLQSYVPEWPGVMCVYGVTQIGAGSAGPGRWLPGLLAALQLIKPLVVFGSGAWFVLYLLNRATATGPLLGRLFVALLACGALSVADAGTELTYLVIPKKEEVPVSGCCTGAFADRHGAWAALAGIADDPATRPWLYAAYGTTNVVMLLALAGFTRRSRPAPGRVGLAARLAGAAAALAASAAFLVEVAAPAVLHLPYHHCPYDLIPAAPDVLAGVALFVGATFAVGWACVAGWFGRAPDTAAGRAAAVSRLLFLAFCGYLGSAVLVVMELALA